MKRTNLVLDEHILKKAIQVLGVKNYSEAVQIALKEVIRMSRVRDMERFFGTGIWKDDLKKMREDKK